MQVFVSDFTQPIHACELEDVKLPNLLFLTVPRWTLPDDIENFLSRIPEDIKTRADAVVIRAHRSEAHALLSLRDNHGDHFTHIRNEITHRVEGRPTWLLHWHNGFDLHGLTRSTEQVGLPLRELVAALRVAEMDRLLSRPGVSLPKNDDYHYRGPNGSHYRSFARLGFAFTSPETLDAIAFWALPHVTAHTPVLLDSWTLLSLGLNVHRYANEHGIEADTDARLVDAIGSYGESDELIVRRIQSLVSAAESRSLLLVNSVRSSGRLTERIVKICAGLTLNLQILTLCSVKGANSLENETVMYELPSDYIGHSFLSCPGCPKPLVQINPSTYLLELSAKAKPTQINQKDANSAKIFLERYRGVGCISVHRTRNDPYRSRRHHMVHIDVPAMVVTDMFRNRLSTIIVEKLAGHIDVVLCPSHPGCQSLAALCAELLNLDAPIVSDEQTLDAHSEHLDRSRGILLVDDVVTTGTRLRSYKRKFQDMQLAKPYREIHVLIGVARTSSMDDLKGIADMVHHPRTLFHAVEQIIIPDWNENDCPWCWETQRLRELSALGKLHGSMAARLGRLEDASGLKDGLFACWTNPNADLMTLGEGSIFGEGLTTAELFFAVASAIQTLRDEGRLVEEPQPPVGYVLSTSKYLTGRFYGPVISAAILRAARAHDLRNATMEASLIRKVTAALTEPGNSELKAELLLAVAQGKLPPAQSNEVLPLNGDRDLCDFLPRLFGAT